MGQFHIEEEISASVDAAWALLSDFGNLGDWAPGVAGCVLEGSGVGAVRNLDMGGMKIAEKLLSLDEASKTFSYSIEEGPLPVQNYVATVTVSDAGAGKAKIGWGATFDNGPLNDEQAAGVASGVEGSYRGMIEAAAKHLG